MLIERLRLQDFLLFPGNQELRFRFKNGKNATAILADMGKTSVVRALSFLLYGERGVRPLSDVPLINIQAASRAAPGRAYESAVEAQARLGERSLTLRRRIVWERDGSASVRVIEQSLVVTRHDNQDGTPDDELTSDLLARESPRAVGLAEALGIGDWSSVAVMPGGQACLFDSVLGQIEEGSRAPIVAGLAGSVDQAIFLFSGRDWSPAVELGLGGTLTDAYVFECCEPYEKPYGYSFRGSLVPAFRQVPRGEPLSVVVRALMP